MLSSVIATLDVLFVYIIESFIPNIKCRTLFNIRPPSNGYIGIKLNSASNIFENIINSDCILKITHIKTTNIFTTGPGKAYY